MDGCMTVTEPKQSPTQVQYMKGKPMD